MMTVAEVEELLGSGQNFVYRLVSKPGFPAVKVANSYRISRGGLMEWLDAQKVNNTPEVLHNMWDPEVAPYPAGEKLENTIIDMKKKGAMQIFYDDELNHLDPFANLSAGLEGKYLCYGGGCETASIGKVVCRRLYNEAGG